MHCVNLFRLGEGVSLKSQQRLSFLLRQIVTLSRIFFRLLWGWWVGDSSPYQFILHYLFLCLKFHYYFYFEIPKMYQNFIQTKMPYSKTFRDLVQKRLGRYYYCHASQLKHEQQWVLGRGSSSSNSSCYVYSINTLKAKRQLSYFSLLSNNTSMYMYILLQLNKFCLQ